MDIKSFDDMSIGEFVNRYFNGESDKEELIKNFLSVGIDRVGDLENIEHTELDVDLEGTDEKKKKIIVKLDSGIINNLKDLVVSKRPEWETQPLHRKAAEYRLQNPELYDILTKEHPLLDYLATKKNGGGKRRKKYSKKKKKSKSKRSSKSKRKRSKTRRRI